MKWLFPALFLVLLSSLVFAVSVDKNGTSFSSTGTGVVWTNPINAQNEEGTIARSILTQAATTSQQLDANVFGFAVPSTATIDGVLVEVKKQMGTATSGVNLTDFGAGLLGVTGSSDKSDLTEYTTTLTFYSYGGSSDLWGTTITPAQVNDGGFGFRLRTKVKQGTELTGTYTARAQVDYIRITVTYTPAASAAT